MPRSRRKEGASPSDDYGWRWGEAVEGSRNNVKCKFCERIITGGITRLKEHLAGKTGNVKACECVSSEVRKNIAEQLKEYQKEKSVRQRRKEELEERIKLGDHGDYGDSDDEEDELTIARRESIRSRHEWEERQHQRARTGQDSVYEPGGGSSSASQLFRTFSVRKPAGTGRSEREHRWTNFDSPGAKLANMDPVLERSKSSKQPKLTTSFLKNAKAKLGRVISKLILHEALPARIAESPFLPPVLQVAAEFGKSVKGPSAYEVTGVYLDEEYKEIQEWVNGFKPIWKERGVTLMCDGWKGTRNQHIINFLVYSPRGTIFKKSIDASSVTSRTAEYYFGIMDEIVDEIGEEYIVQVVTDNEAAVKAGGQMLMQKRSHLYWSACSAHCLDLILEEIGNRTSVKKVLDQAKQISSFIYNHTWTIDYMKRYTKGAELLRPGITRFATNFIALESIVRSKQALKEMVTSSEWKRSTYARRPAGQDMMKVIDSNQFWKKAADVLKIQEPLVKVLRMCDGDEKPTMGFIYEAMDRAKLAIQRDCRYYQKYWDIIDRRWSRQLHNDLHSAGYYLNPQFLYGANSSNEVLSETMAGVRNVIQRIEPSLNDQILAMNQLLLYRDKVDSFGTPLAQAAILKTNPGKSRISS
ncbi:hypothetical protein V6N12_030954 [Hibiscus sabdariffa]|uniref:BED-type domain-containing protein n=1 Tax=Hibiscus sabdariffa TaxID=183260 RepID=A0ABR2E7H3_9ROSI